MINLSTLQGLDSCPGYVPGVGPIPPEVARELAADRAWRAWITETRSTRDTVVATSPRTYRPPAGLARLLRAREPHCRMPGCRSMVTDLDHIVPFPGRHDRREPPTSVPATSSDEDPHPMAGAVRRGGLLDLDQSGTESPSATSRKARSP